MKTTNYLDEGYIKYHCEWQQAAAPPADLLTDLNHWRQQMYDLRLIGYYDEHGVGYGNISIRNPHNPQKMIISGTQTGHISHLEAHHYTMVESYDLTQNRLTCRGPIKASSESLTHAAIYELDPSHNAVIHIHHLGMWQHFQNKVPTTQATIPYGTPEMAFDILRLYKNTDLKHRKIIVMAGHEEGIIVFGRDMEEAGQTVLKYYQQFMDSK